MELSLENMAIFFFGNTLYRGYCCCIYSTVNFIRLSVKLFSLGYINEIVFIIFV